MDNENDHAQNQAIQAFEDKYKQGLPCHSYYSAEELGRLVKHYCLNCGWHEDEHGAYEA